MTLRTLKIPPKTPASLACSSLNPYRPIITEHDVFRGNGRPLIYRYLQFMKAALPPSPQKSWSSNMEGGDVRRWSALGRSDTRRRH
ncbi:hypothetical protein BaRGS_00036693 [Batillaria attramentaria]|uniref:Uncharacterized protein n=1 Tax=Batillaria attramentaria TaxID=370345 RepID=A0ABD0JAX4_9CAEN